MDEATLRWTGGTTFEAVAGDGGRIQIDMPTEYSGTGYGFHPMELLLHALGGCMATTIAQILAKQRTQLESYTVRLHGERAEERPRPYTHILVEHVFRGQGLVQANLERLVHRVEEHYCSVAATLPRGLAEHRVVIEQVSGPAGQQTSSPLTPRPPLPRAGEGEPKGHSSY
jgi:putative redox protein